jgi:hypothetical protein
MASASLLLFTTNFLPFRLTARLNSPTNNSALKSLLSSTISRRLSQILKVALRPTISRPVCLGVRLRSGTCDQFSFLLEIFFRQLRVCYFTAPSLTIGHTPSLFKTSRHLPHREHVFQHLFSFAIVTIGCRYMYVCMRVCLMLDCWLEVSCIRKVLRPANSIKVFRGFPWSQSKC